MSEPGTSAPWSAQDSNPLEDMREFIKRSREAEVAERARLRATRRRMKSLAYQVCVGPYIGWRQQQ